jgi:2-oxoglutarate dehydrogenase E2 component (dihydrolipoamide succinyltransferase)
VEGTLVEVLYNENDIVPVDTVIAKIDCENNIAAQYTSPSKNEHTIEAGKEEPLEIKTAHQEVPYQPASSENIPASLGARFYSPLVLNIAAGEGISLAELENIPGSGNEGRVTKKDMLEWVEKKKSGAAYAQQPQTEASSVYTTTQTAPSQQIPIPPEEEKAAHNGNVEIIEMDRMRKMIAKHMLESKQISPHVTSFMECDVTNLVQWRDKIKANFEKQEGEKITFMPLFVEAIAKCIKKFPWVNASVEGDKIIVKKDINIGMATALPDGNLIVPVIKNADYLNLTGLTKKINALANLARNGRLKADDTQDGTFTVTNIGTFGSLMGTPIINQPQVAILAVGAIKKRPVVIETTQGDSIAIRYMMYLSMSFDHRIVDGSIGAGFLTAVANELEQFDVNRKF